MNGQHEVRAPHATHWMLYLDEKVEVKIDYRRAIPGVGRKEYICRVCQTKTKSPREVDFHKQYAHFGGKPCDTCLEPYFTLKRLNGHTCSMGEAFIKNGKKDNHKLLPNLTNLHIICFEGNRIYVDTGIILFRVFLLPLVRNGKRIVWCGKGMASTAIENAKNALDRCNRVVEDDDNDGCTSLTELITNVEPWKPLPGEAFFVNLPGGRYSAIDSLKNLLRRALKTAGHNVSLKCTKHFSNVMEFVASGVQTTDGIPEYNQTEAKKFFEQTIRVRKSR